MRIIAAIDIMDGKCVRLTNGDYATKKMYSENPVEMAKEFEGHGIRYLHLVDLDGARQKTIVNHQVLKAITSQTQLQVDFGGGLKTSQDLKIAFDNGAVQITGGSVAVTNPDLFVEWLGIYGASKIMLGADCNHRQIFTHGWLQNAGVDVIDFIKDYQAQGIQYAVCTDIGKDGMLQGAAHDLYAEILSHVNIKLIASGGVTSLADLDKLRAIGCEAAIIGKAIYEKKILLSELSKLC